MLKKIKETPTVNVKWQGEVVASVRGLTPADLAAVLTVVGEDLGSLFSVVEDVESMDLDTRDAGRLADQMLQSWPKIVSSVGTHLPNLIAQVIARAADAPEEWEMVRDYYSFALQFDILAEVARMTFNEPEGFRRFVGNALLLVDLAGTLTSGSSKRPKPALGQKPSASG